MATVELLNKLWAGKLLKCEFNFLTHTCILIVELMYSGIHRSLILEARGLRTFSLVYETEAALSDADSWAYMEMTSIVAKRIYVGGMSLWKLEGELWMEPQRVSLVCSQIALDGALLEES